jgi:phosphoglycerate dehydrogenase-like enzyme
MFRDLDNSRRKADLAPVTLVNGHGNSYFTAQHAVAMLLALANRIVPHHNWMREGRWRTGDDDAASTPIRDRQVGLLGYGAVNRRVHEFLKGFDVSFAALRTEWSKANSDEADLKRFTVNELDQFLSWSDILFVSVPLTSVTEGMIGEEELELLGPDGLLVNMARGPVVSEEPLYRALRGGRIAGAALDVWYDYRPEADELGRKCPAHYPFHELDNVVLSPHRGASPFSDLRRWGEVVENIRRFAAGRTDFLNVVDLDREY